MSAIAQPAGRTTVPTLEEALVADLGAKDSHDMNIDVALQGGLLYATHSFTPREGPNPLIGPGELVVLSAESLTEIRRVPIGAQPKRVAIHPNTGRAYVLCNAPEPDLGLVVMVDAGAHMPGHRIVLGWGATDLAVDPVTRRVYVASARTRSVLAFDADDGTPVAEFPLGNRVLAVTVDHTRGLVYAAVESPTENRLAVIDGTADAVVANILLDTTAVVPQDVAVNEALGEVYVACAGGVGHTGPSVFVVAPQAGSVRRFPLPTPGRTVDVDPVVGQLYVAGEGSIYVLDGASGALREQRSFEGRPGRLAVNRTTGAVYLGHRWTGRVVAYRSAVQHPAPPPPPPTLTLSGSGARMNLFRQDANGTLETAAYAEEDDWFPFSTVGGTPGAFPPGTRFASLAPAPGAWWLFGVDEAGVLRGAVGSGQTVGGWHHIGDGFVPGAEVAWASAFPGSTFIFAVDATGTVRSYAFGSDGPFGSEGIHGGMVFAPGAPIAAVSRKSGHWDLFAQQSDGTVYTQWWSTDEDEPSRWGALDGGSFLAGTHIAVLARKDDQLDLFGVDASGRVSSAFWNNEQGWSPWAPVADGGPFPAGAPVAVTSAKPDIINLFCVGTDERVWTSFWKAEDGWADWRPLDGRRAATPGAAVVVGRRDFEELDLCWLAKVDEVQHAWWTRHQGAWSFERGVDRPVGLESRFFSARIDSDKPVKGDIRITCWPDGGYLVKGHMHGSGFDPYQFIVQAAVPIRGGAGDDVGALTTYQAGRVDGWEPFGDEERSYDWAQLGDSFNVRRYFSLIPNNPGQSPIVAHQVKNDGIGGALDTLVGDVIEHFVEGIVLKAVGGTLVVALGLGRTIEGLLDVDIKGWAGFAIITVGTGGFYWLAVPHTAVMIPMLPGGSGVPIGAEHRQMRDEEWAWAARVFGGTLPHFSSIRITNLKNPNDGAFVSVDGSGDGATYLVHMGAQAFEDPKSDDEGGTVVPGSTFIHELTHVWEAFHGQPWWEWEALWDLCTSPGPKQPDPSQAWDDLGIEEKANAIEEWYRRHHADLDSPSAISDDYFHYVANHIREP